MEYKITIGSTKCVTKYCLSLQFLFLLIVVGSSAQKKQLDSSDFNKWPTITGNVHSTQKGDFLSYTVSNNQFSNNILIIKSLKTDWNLNFNQVIDFQFTNDSKYAIILTQSDSLYFVKLGSNKSKVISNVESFCLLKNKKETIIGYKLKNVNKDFILYNFSSSITSTYKNVNSYNKSDNNNALLLTIRNVNNDSLYLIDLNKLNSTCIWSGNNTSNIIFDSNANKIAFLENSNVNHLWIYKKSINKVFDFTPLNDLYKEYKINKIIRFSNDTSALFFSMEMKNKEFNKTDSSIVKIWSFSDVDIFNSMNKPTSFQFVLILKNSFLVRLQNEGEKITFFEKSTDQFAFLSFSKGYMHENYWNKRNIIHNYIINCKTGNKFEIPIRYCCDISPNGKYLVGLDETGKRLSCVNLDNGSINELISENSITSEKKIGINDSLSFINAVSFCGWTDDQNRIIINDLYDIWELDLIKNIQPNCVTKRNGRKFKIKFRYISSFKNSKSNYLLLSAFEESKKRNCIFKFNTSKNFVIPYSQLENTLINYPDDSYTNTPIPLKLGNSDTWIVQKQSSKESPNLYSTIDFFKYRKISNIHPERSYNWLTSELISFQIDSIESCQGILYKPENFDPKIKYPLIINLYEEKSHLLNFYIKPEVTGDDINIPWFTSNGYLVFTPDINNYKYYPFKNAFNVIISGVKYLKNNFSVDSTKMGIQGHSYGGHLVNYIIAHSNVFAAAISASATSDLISSYLSLRHGKSNQFYYETGQGKLFKNLWDGKDAYIAGSPVLDADKVTTPLLLMCGENDPAVNPEQSIGFFLALRRLNKDSWLLNYKNEDHTLMGDLPKIDYMYKMDQFFDYYLKGKALPIWMLEK